VIFLICQVVSLSLTQAGEFGLLLFGPGRPPEMEITRIAILSLISLTGIVILIFNKQIGEYAEKNFRIFHSLPVPWFPRLNAIAVGVLITVAGIANLIDELMSK
jgi:hypothetical protein